MILFSFPQLRL